MTERLDDILVRDGKMKILLNVSYAYGEVLDSLSKVGNLLNGSQCAVIKDQKKVKVGHTSLRCKDVSAECYIKQYKAFSLRKKLEGIFLPSRISRAWEGARLLLARGIRTAEPIAAIEMRRFGLLQESYYVSKAIPESEISVHYFEKEFGAQSPNSVRRRREFVRALARFFRSLHQENIYHSDLKDYNILVSAGDGPNPYAFWLLDVECVGRFGPIGGRRRLKNLIQINKTLGEKMKLTDRLAFLKEYLGAGEAERLGKKQKALIRKVFRRSP